jgi:hypothetical protein
MGIVTKIAPQAARDIKPNNLLGFVKKNMSILPEKFKWALSRDSCFFRQADILSLHTASSMEEDSLKVDF